MLRLRIERQDLAAGWRSASDGWEGGTSRIVPFRNEFLETVAAHAEGRFVFAVRERTALAAPLPEQSEPLAAVSAERFDALAASIRSWPLEWLAVTIDTRAQSLEIAAGRWGNAPLYLIDAGTTLHGSWDPADLYPHLGTNPLSPASAARFLASFEHPYSRRTLFDKLLRVTERSVARWSPHAPLTIDYPDAMPVPEPHALRDGADPPAIAAEILSASMRRWLAGTSAAAGAELSGGLDSGIVAVTAAGLTSPPLRTYGILQAGSPGIGQRERRAELITRFAFADTAIEAFDFPPLAVRDDRFVPWEEIYIGAASELVRRAAHDGVAALFTGIGGDELCRLHRSEQSQSSEPEAPIPSFLTRTAREALREAPLDLAPRPAMAYSSIEGLAASAPLYLRHGVWPIAPLTTAELFRFVRSLPAEWRAGRRLSRELLARRGCSSAVTHPQSTETFAPLFHHGLTRAARPFLRELFSSSRLADLDLVDAARLRATYDDFCEGRLDAGFDAMPLYAAAALEVALRSVESRAEVCV